MSDRKVHDVTVDEKTCLVLSEINNESTQNGYDVSPHQNYSTTHQTFIGDGHADKAKGDDNDHGQNQTEPKKSGGLKFFRSLSGRRKYTLILVTFCVFLSTVVYSFLGPFFPREAAKKDMNLTLVGIVFGIFELVVFLTSPIYGNYLVRLGPRFVYISGIFLAGTCNILFGTLQYCPRGTPFIVLSILVRATEALGVSAYITASLAIVSSQLKENVGLALGIVESAAGLGFMLGPTIGAGLFEAGGFSLPFYCAGCAILLNALTVYKFLPAVEEEEIATKKRERSPVTLFKSPLVLVSMLVVISAMMGITASDTTLSKRLQPLDMSVGLVGVVFGVLAGVFSVMSTVMGYVSDTRHVRGPLIVGGLLVYGIGYSLAGPSFLLPFIPETNLVALLLGLAMIGAGFGCTVVPTMKCMLIGAKEMGFDDNIDTYALVAGLYNSVQTFGGFLGPMVSGYLIQEYNFPVGYGVLGLISLATMVVLIVFFSHREYRMSREGQGRGRDQETG